MGENTIKPTELYKKKTTFEIKIGVTCKKIDLLNIMVIYKCLLKMIFKSY